MKHSIFLILLLALCAEQSTSAMLRLTTNGLKKTARLSKNKQRVTPRVASTTTDNDAVTQQQEFVLQIPAHIKGFPYPADEQVQQLFQQGSFDVMQLIGKVIFVTPKSDLVPTSGIASELGKVAAGKNVIEEGLEEDAQAHQVAEKNDDVEDVVMHETFLSRVINRKNISIAALVGICSLVGYQLNKQYKKRPIA